jgi:hypothetical protein
MTLFKESAPVVRAGLADLDARSGARGGFSVLTTSEQISIMQRVEKTPFFAAARSLVVMGALSDPTYGGNAAHGGWMLIGMEHHPSYAAPFGWYDTELRNTVLEAP